MNADRSSPPPLRRAWPPAARHVAHRSRRPRSRAGGISGLDPTLHFLEGSRADVARYVLILDAINFGSGWFGELDTTTDALTERLTAHTRERGAPWTAAELRALDAAAVGETLGLEPEHQLTRLYSAGLNHLGLFLGDRPILDLLGDSAERLAERLATGMPFFDDRGYYKRAQIAANDLHLAGVVDFADVDRLTVFADNLVPHVLRLDGVLHLLRRARGARRRRGRSCAAGGEFERELRGCAVHACEQLARRLGVTPALLDNWLWNRGQQPPYSERPAHITRTCLLLMDAFEGLVGELEYPMFIVTARVGGEPLGCLVGFTTQASIDPPRFIACLSHQNRTYRARQGRARRSACTRCPPTRTTSRSCSAARPRTRRTSSRARRGTKGPRACRSSSAARTGSSAASWRATDAGDHDAFLLEPIAGSSTEEDEFTFHRAKRIDPGHEA